MGSLILDNISRGKLGQYRPGRETRTLGHILARNLSATSFIELEFSRLTQMKDSFNTWCPGCLSNALSTQFPRCSKLSHFSL